MTSLDISDRPVVAQTTEMTKIVVAARAVSLGGRVKTVRKEEIDEH
jgi:hypothetical protein